MKQKIVLQVPLTSCKLPRKALKIIAEAYGVESLGIEGQKKNQVFAIGDGIDIITLAQKLRKKIGCTDVISVTELN